MVPVLIAALVVAVWAFSYHTSDFKGGIGIRDTGFFSYPRYHAEIGQAPLWKDGDYHFLVSGLPPGPLDLTVQVTDATYNDKTELTSLTTSMSVSISDGSGQVLCKASGMLSDATRRGLNTWVLESSWSHAAFWQQSCLQLPISQSKTYTVKLALAGADEHSPHKMLKPILQGGGNELP